MYKTIVAIIVVAVMAGGVFFVARSEKVASGSQTREVELHVEEGKLVHGPSVFKVTKGDTVVVRVTADEADEFHLHGYDKSAELEPGEEATLSFVADTTGRFNAELEEVKVDVWVLEVLP